MIGNHFRTEGQHGRAGVDERAARLAAELNGRPVEPRDGGVAYRVAKRAFDVAFSAAALVALSPLLAVVAVAIKAEDPHAPVLFRQERIGKDGVPFRMYKFRSMVAGAEDMLEDVRHLNIKDGPVFKVVDDPRITPVGRFIRRTSIDEVPNFVNVLAGQMSVVGPRPALPREVEEYGAYEMQRLRVKPGITCYWQSHADRDDVSFEDWMALDALYIREASVGTDAWIILRTVAVVLSAKGN